MEECLSLTCRIPPGSLQALEQRLVFKCFTGSGTIFLRTGRGLEYDRGSVGFPLDFSFSSMVRVDVGSGSLEYQGIPLGSLA